MSMAEVGGQDRQALPDVVAVMMPAQQRLDCETMPIMPLAA